MRPILTFLALSVALLPALSAAEAEKVTTDPAHETERRRLQSALKQFLAIKSEISPELKGGKGTKPAKRKQK